MSRYFTEHEFACACCGETRMDPQFMERLINARVFAGIPFIITSGYRCPKHNAEVGSTSTNHTSGLAADIACTTGPARLTMVKALLDAGFSRIGIGPTFIHADANEGPNSIWLYPA